MLKLKVYLIAIAQLLRISYAHNTTTNTNNIIIYTIWVYFPSQQQRPHMKECALLHSITVLLQWIQPKSMKFNTGISVFNVYHFWPVIGGYEVTWIYSSDTDFMLLNLHASQNYYPYHFHITHLIFYHEISPWQKNA